MECAFQNRGLCINLMSSILIFLMSYQSAIAQLNAMAPELQSKLRPAAAQVFSGRDWDPSDGAEQSASAISFGVNCGNEREGIDGIDTRRYPFGFEPAHRAVYVSAPDAAQRANPR